MIISLVLPGVNASILGKSLKNAIQNITVHEDIISENTPTPSVCELALSDFSILLWSTELKKGAHLCHGKDLLDEFMMNPIFGSLNITFLGNPILRALDTYRNISNSPSHPLHQILTTEKMSLTDFYQSPVSKPVRNRQCRKLARLLQVETLTPEKLYKIASQKLRDQFAWVGLEGITTGQQPELRRLLKTHRFECSVPVFDSWQKRRDLPDKATQKILCQANAADWMLWQEAICSRTGILRRLLTRFSGR